MSQDYNAADLNSILKTLSAFSNPTTNNTPQQSHPSSNNEDENDYEPPEAVTPSLPKHSPPSPLSHSFRPNPLTTHVPTSSSLSRPQPQAKESPTTATTIATWPAALKQVMRTVAQNEHLQQRIRFLIQRQHDHERQWWKGREALLQRQKSRATRKKELDQVLRSVGAPVDEKEVSTAEEDAAEIQNYDGKVYKASKQMADAMIAELRALHIPFFCLKQSLIANGTTDQKMVQSQGSASATVDGQGRISVDELSALQRRMLELLQDLCRE
ncbi:hypothetical protein BJY01DRAFT_248563 [Aspergillus pseudoustus]|uniref:Uncharacterized protein n=1 Tax=Aspergillus pseudoustus TaxID=1810923 RepID=A0ABR4JUF0_9EURO